jgi:hypothetical protein
MLGDNTSAKDSMHTTNTTFSDSGRRERVNTIRTSRHPWARPTFPQLNVHVHTVPMAKVSESCDEEKDLSYVRYPEDQWGV